MSMPANQDNFSYVLPGGQIVLTAVFETYAWSGTEQPVSGVQITIAPVGGGAALVGPTSAGITEVDQATYTYTWQPAVSTPAADYLVTWTAATPGGIAPVTLVVTVVALPAQTPGPGVYATVAQYQTETGDTMTPVAKVMRLLPRASRIIDRALIAAVYPVDADGMPTVASHIDIFMRATCAQVEYMVANDDPAGIKTQYSSITFGGMTAVRSAREQGAVLPKLAPEAAQILLIEGVLGAAPLVNW